MKSKAKSIHDWIASKADALTAGEMRLAAHLGEHVELWAFESAAQLSGRLGVHRSSVVRLAQKLGMSGFPELQEKVRTDLLKSFSPALDQAVTDQANASDGMVERIYQRELMNLRQTYEGLNVAELEVTAREMAAADRIVVFGRRFSYPIALHLSLVLNTMRPGIRLAPEPGGSAIDFLFDLTPRDYALVVSLRRHSPEVQRTIDFLSSLKVPRALLTDVSVKVEPIPGMRVLQAYVGSDSIFNSFTALSSVSHTLLAMISRHIEDSHKRLEASERAWKQYNRLSPKDRLKNPNPGEA
ncbi:MAG: MurR/RpiR family transcriptional regulator [Pseudomonadota bacterium]